MVRSRRLTFTLVAAAAVAGTATYGCAAPDMPGAEAVGAQSETMLGAGRITPQGVANPPGWHTAAPLPADANGPQFPAGGGMAAFSRVPGNMDVVTIGFDGKLWSAGAWDNGWQKPFAMPNQTAGFVPGGGIAAVSRVPNLLETYAIGYDGKLWNTGSYDDVSGWRAPFPTKPGDTAGFKPGGGIAAVSRSTSILDTFAIGYDGHLWETGAWDDTKGAWQAAFPVPGDAVFQVGGGVAAATTDANHIYTFTIGNDGQLWCAGAWATSQWIPSFKIEPQDPSVHFPVGSPLAATVRDHAVLDVWVLGYDGQLWNAGSCNVSSGACDGNWSVPYKPSPQSNAVFKVGGGIAATARTKDHIDVLAIGNDQRTWEVAWWGFECSGLGAVAGDGCCSGLVEATALEGGDVCVSACGNAGQYPCTNGGCTGGGVDTYGRIIDSPPGDELVVLQGYCQLNPSCGHSGVGCCNAGSAFQGGECYDNSYCSYSVQANPFAGGFPGSWQCKAPSNGGGGTGGSGAPNCTAQNFYEICDGYQCTDLTPACTAPAVSTGCVVYAGCCGNGTETGCPAAN